MSYVKGFSYIFVQYILTLAHPTLSYFFFFFERPGYLKGGGGTVHVVVKFF